MACRFRLISALLLLITLPLSLWAEEGVSTQAEPVASEPTQVVTSASAENEAVEQDDVPVADNIDLREVVIELDSPERAPETKEEPPAETTLQDKPSTPEAIEPETTEIEVTEADVPAEVDKAVTPAQAADVVGEPEQAVDEASPPDATRVLLGVKVPPATSTRLSWVPVESFGELTVNTPVLIVNGRLPGKTLCLTAAVHGDELNGIEMIRRVVYDLDPNKLTGTVIGVPIVNLTAFRRGSRYLPDRRDLNRYFPGNPTGSGAARMAYSFFNEVVHHCDALVDLHTGSFYRTNLPQLRADLSHPGVLELSQSFGAITVLNSQGHPGSLRAAAVRAGIPAVTMEAGEPMRLQSDVVAEGTKAIDALMHKMGMYARLSIWANPSPAYYQSHWVRADQSGFLFSRVTLGKRVSKGEVLGRITDPITNEHADIISPYRGRVLGMALDQMVLPGFAAYHIGIQTSESILSEDAVTHEQEVYDDESDRDEVIEQDAVQSLDTEE